MAGVLVGCGSGGDFFTGLGSGTLSHSVSLTVLVQ